jgi:hypothetical protein
MAVSYYAKADAILDGTIRNSIDDPLCRVTPRSTIISRKICRNLGVPAPHLR